MTKHLVVGILPLLLSILGLMLTSIALVEETPLLGESTWGSTCTDTECRLAIHGVDGYL